MSHLIVTERKDRPGTYQIAGTVPGYARLRQNAKAQAGNGLSKGGAKKLAVAEAALLEADMLKRAVYGDGPDSGADRFFAAIAEEYLAFETRHPAQVMRVNAVVEALGNVHASAVTQEVVDGLKKTMLQTRTPARSTIKTFIVMPISCVLNFGWRRGWCAKALPFELPKLSTEEKARSRPKIMLPDEAQRLVEAATGHLKPVLITMFGLGSRVTETLNLEWDNVDLVGGKVSYIQKGGRWRHGVVLPPAVIATMAGLPGPRTGKVFLNTRGRGQRGNHAYLPRIYGGQIKSAFDTALLRAGLDGHGLTPHCCRHSYASWHMAIWKNPLKLKFDGGWEDTKTLEIYMHLMPEGHEGEILNFWGYRNSDTRLTPALQGLLLSA
jgi:integrase